MLQVTGASFVCVCNFGWTGERCNQALNPCDSQPCQNNGTCVSHPNATFTCTCTSSFTGTLCQQPQRGTVIETLTETRLLACSRTAMRNPRLPF